MTERMFPVLYGHTKAEEESRKKGPLEVPWRLLQPHERQALINHDQTLERLAQRGGLREFSTYEVEEQCNTYGEEGWDISFIDLRNATWYVVFKRPLVKEPADDVLGG